jgi:hypothetical protein
MDASSSTLVSTGLLPAHRADAGSVRLGRRDVAGLMLVGGHRGPLAQRRVRRHRAGLALDQRGAG